MVLLEKIDSERWRIPQHYIKGMRAPSILYATKGMINRMKQANKGLESLIELAFMPGIVKHVVGMPNLRNRYGFPTGAIVAVESKIGVAAPGGVGSGINSGVRLLQTDLNSADIKERIPSLIHRLWNSVPAGVNQQGRYKLSKVDIESIFENGARWAVENGMGREKDLEVTEERGCVDGASAGSDPGLIAAASQSLGALGSAGNFITFFSVKNIYDPAVAHLLSLTPDQICAAVRADAGNVGFQICQNHLNRMQSDENSRVRLFKRELICAPIESESGARFLAGVAAAENFAWATRQIIIHRIRQALSQELGSQTEPINMPQLFDVSENLPRIESYSLNRRAVSLAIYRKGCARAFPAGHLSLAAPYRSIGQPVLIRGGMSDDCYIVVGTDRAFNECFGSIPVESARKFSRFRAGDIVKNPKVSQDLEKAGVYVKFDSSRTLREESSNAFYPTGGIVNLLERCGLIRKIARLQPISIMKG
ncbi:MAG: hypothetical protein B6244_03445 [Candidatus Cloacimonetes bacterium 4572_55]|nr:MAG: hypothetical protein B6244_03445 [Candidatus Cloacimonetes bacterium 4572_55]